MIMYDIKALYEAGNVEDAIRLLQEHPEAQIIAGGSDVLVQMREGRRAGKELVSIYRLDEMRGISYEEDGVRNPFKLRNCNIYISTGYSASACIFFIRGLMKKYEFDISEDFVYSAKPNNTSIN